MTTIRPRNEALDVNHLKDRSEDHRMLRFLCLTAMGALVWLFLGSQAPAQAKDAKNEQKAIEAKLREAAKQQLNLAEVTLLRRAYLLLNAANGDYAGHRGKAIKHLNQAITMLEVQIAHKGTKAQEQENMRQEAIRAYYKSKRVAVPAVIEPQVLSDAQVYQAGLLLGHIRGVLAQNNQRRILEHIDHSLTEVRLALKTR